MTRKSLGHIELQWTCPNCSGINPGPEQVCASCGAPQPDDVEFVQAERQELITDEEVKAKMGAGADIHCPYCGTRNKAGTVACTHCGGDLVEGVKRDTGRVLGAYKTGPATQVKCPHCGADNIDTAKECTQCGGSMVPPEVEPPPQDIPVPTAGEKGKTRIPVGLIIILVLLCVVVAAVAILSMRTEDVTGVVQEVRWERTIPIEAIVPVEYSDWFDSIPAEATVGNCKEEVRTIQDEPAPNSQEVCGTPYSVDKGDGYAEVVQDCVYHVFDDFCTYTVQEWSQVDVASVFGSDFAPYWPDPELEDSQRLGGESSESYVIYFDTGSEVYSYQTSEYDLYQRCQIGSQWNLSINSFGGVVSIER